MTIASANNESKYIIKTVKNFIELFIEQIVSLNNHNSKDCSLRYLLFPISNLTDSNYVKAKNTLKL